MQHGLASIYQAFDGFGSVAVYHNKWVFVGYLVRNWDIHKCITMYIAGGVLLTATVYKCRGEERNQGTAEELREVSPRGLIR